MRERIKLRAGTTLMVVAFNGGLRLMPLVPAANLRGIARGTNPELAAEADRPL